MHEQFLSRISYNFVVGYREEDSTVGRKWENYINSLCCSVQAKKLSIGEKVFNFVTDVMVEYHMLDTSSASLNIRFRVYFKDNIR